MRKWLVVFASMCLMESAQASANVCGGVVSVGKEWTTVKGDGFVFDPGCRFRTNSKVGRRILVGVGGEARGGRRLGQGAVALKRSIMRIITIALLTTLAMLAPAPAQDVRFRDAQGRVTPAVSAFGQTGH
jgi:hypothetical protein